ncbi:MAG: hypothetical protein IMZ67_02105 [Acidobacteria bacterium]|nr:hypothetical protein [Acidobacteriota bacterium]
MKLSKIRSQLVVIVLIAGGLVAAGATSVAAQAVQTTQATQASPPRVPRRAAAAQARGRYSVVEVQQMFDAYALMQAEQALKLDEMQYPPFLSRLRALQQLRRRHLQARHQIVQQLATLTAPQAEPVDEGQVRDRLKALVDLDAGAVADMRAAYDAIDQILDVRQQARFRILEEQLERRKFDLLARARRVGTPDPGPPRAPIR